MAYSNYGALIWKNGKEVTKEYADKSYEYKSKDKKWIDVTDEEITGETETRCGGHAVIPYKNILITFYKTWGDIYETDNKGNIKHKSLSAEESNDDYVIYNSEQNGITINCYVEEEFIYCYDILFKKEDEHWFVIVGSALGNGWDNRYITKFLRKTIYKDKRSAIDKPIKSNVYDKQYFLPFYGFGNEFKLGYYIRKDDRKDIKKDLWKFGIKRFLKDLISFNSKGYYFENIRVTWQEEIIKRLKQLYYLR